MMCLKIKRRWFFELLLARSHCLCLYSLRACKRQRARALDATRIIRTAQNTVWTVTTIVRSGRSGNVLSCKRDPIEQIQPPSGLYTVFMYLKRLWFLLKSKNHLFFTCAFILRAGILWGEIEKKNPWQHFKEERYESC